MPIVVAQPNATLGTLRDAAAEAATGRRRHRDGRPPLLARSSGSELLWGRAHASHRPCWCRRAMLALAVEGASLLTGILALSPPAILGSAISYARGRPGRHDRCSSVAYASSNSVPTGRGHAHCLGSLPLCQVRRALTVVSSAPEALAQMRWSLAGLGSRAGRSHNPSVPGTSSPCTGIRSTDCGDGGRLMLRHPLPPGHASFDADNHRRTPAWERAG